MSSQESLGSELTSGLAGFGRVYAIFSAIVATLFGIIFITWGIYILDTAGKPNDPNPPPGTPTNLTSPNNNSTTVGWVLIVLGVLAIIFSWIWVYITSKSKTAAAIGGGIELVRVI